MRNLLVAAILLLGLATVLVAWRIRVGIDSARATTSQTNAGAAVSPASSDLAPQARAPPSRGHRTAAEPDLSSISTDSRATAADGIRILLLDAEGNPMPGMVMDVRWLGEEGELDLQATTDTAGMLATDIADASRIEGIAIDNGFGGLYADGPFETAPGRPHVVVVRVPPIAQVGGFVRDDEGRPIPGARVEIDPEPVLGLDPFVVVFHPMRCEAVTGPEGSFALPIPESCIAMTPDADGFDVGEISFACVEAETPTLVELVLQGASREITVEVCAAGVPLEEAVLVTASRAEAPAHESRVLRDGVRIDRGGERIGPSTYAVRISRDGDWSVAVTLAQGFADARVPVSPKEDRIVVDLRPPLPDPHLLTVRGTITDVRGAPLLAEVVIVHGRDFDWSYRGRSNDTGRFEIEMDSRTVEPVFLFARAPDLGTAGVGPIDRARLLERIDLVLRPAMSISGTVMGPDGTPLAARVSLHPSRGLFATPSGGEAPKGFFDDTFDLFGFEEGEPESAEEGAFSFRGLSAGTYEIWASAKDRTLVLPPGCAVAEAGARDLRIVLGSGLERFVTLEGVIREAGTGRPIAGARVAAGLVRGGPWRSADSFSAEDGSYALPGCLVEALALYVDARGRPVYESEIRPPAPGIHHFDIELLPQRTLRILVLDASGAPLPGRFVSVADARGKPIALRDAKGHGGEEVLATDLRGRVDLHGLPAAEIVVRVGKRVDGGSFVTNVAYQAPNEKQSDPVETRFDLRVAVDSIQRIVISR